MDLKWELSASVRTCIGQADDSVEALWKFEYITVHDSKLILDNLTISAWVNADTFKHRLTNQLSQNFICSGANSPILLRLDNATLNVGSINSVEELWKVRDGIS